VSRSLASSDDGVLTLSAQSGPQEAFLSSSADIAIAGGGSGGGKTVSLLLEPLRHTHDPAFGAVFFRRTYPEIDMEGGPWDLSHMIYPHLGAIPNEGRHEWVFPSGARVKFSHLERELDVYDWKGAQVCLLLFDQIEEFTEFQFWYLLSRNTSLCSARPYVRASCNPDPDSFVASLVSWWIGEDGFPLRERSGHLRWFARPEHSDELLWADSPGELPSPENAKSFTFVPSLLIDNPAALKADPSRVATLRALPMVERKRLLEGNWHVRPTAGMIFDRAWFPIVHAAPVEIIARLRSWDKAGSEGRGKFTVGVLMSVTRDGIFFVEDVVRGQWGSLERERVIKQTAITDGKGVSVIEEQEPGSGGKDSAEATIRMLAGWDVEAKRPSGSKVVRARPYSAQAEAGNVRLVEGSWNKAFLDEHHAFDQRADSGTIVCDQVDAASQGFNKLAAMREEEEEVLLPPPVYSDKAGAGWPQ
jgi:predicted phage terminase large subunit-like protein